MTSDADARLSRLLGGDALAGLRLRLRRRYENAPDAGPTVSFRLADLEPNEVEALAALMGRPAGNASSMQVDLRQIDTALARAGIAPSLHDALERLGGPLIHRPTARAARQAAWTTVADGARCPRLAALLATSPGLGLLKRLARQDPEEATRLRHGADAVLARLPAAGLARAQLAAECLGDAHALDDGRPVAALVLAALRGQEAENDAAERRRAQWARAGVLVNDLARPALALNLPADRPLAPMGEPGYASLRLLVRSPPRWRVHGRTVFVCENPTIVAIAADHMGDRCAPLVCTDGMPAAAQRTLLSQLAEAGAALLYHGDFDWPGLTIASTVLDSFGARPWRFGAGDYLAAVDNMPSHARRLKGRPVDAGWDSALSAAMRSQGVAVHEESVAGILLADLASPP